MSILLLKSSSDFDELFRNVSEELQMSKDNKAIADRWFIEFRSRLADRFSELVLLALLQ